MTSLSPPGGGRRQLYFSLELTAGWVALMPTGGRILQASEPPTMLMGGEVVTSRS